MKKIFALVLTGVLAVSMFAACSSGGYRSETAASSVAMAAPAAMPASNTVSGFGESPEYPVDDAVDYEEAYDMQEAPMETGGGDSGLMGGGPITPVLDSRKIIKNVSMQLQTLTFDSGVDEISKAAESYGGYVQDSYIEGRDMYNTRGTRTANFTLRIPSERLDAFVNALGGQFNVISKSQNSQDITDSYFDSKARLDSLKVQEERLLEMLKTAGELEYMLQVEKELMNVRYEIESLTSSLNRMDSYVSLSTVNITLYEVVKYEPVEDLPVTFGQRITRAFSQSWVAFAEFSQDLAVMLVEALPFLIFLAVIIIVIVLIVRRSNKKRRAIRQQTILTPNVIDSQNVHNSQNTHTTTAEAADENPKESEKE